MTQEDKKILVRDLSARLPHGVRGTVPVEVASGYYDVYDGSMMYDEKEILVELLGIGDGELIEVLILEKGWEDYDLSDYELTLDEFRPYLRPLSSMTDEEKEVYRTFFNYDGIDEYCFKDYIDWLNENHFDYRGLIPKDLAIAVTEENNPYKNDTRK